MNLLPTVKKPHRFVMRLFSLTKSLFLQIPFGLMDSLGINDPFPFEYFKDRIQFFMVLVQFLHQERYIGFAIFLDAFAGTIQ